MVACAPVNTAVPTTITTLPQTATSISPTPTATWWMTPAITATPLNIVLAKDTEIRNVIMQLHPTLCAGANLAIETPPPQDVPAPYPLKFVEVNDPPDPNSYYFEEIADNSDNSRRAFIACKPEKCQDDVYVKDNQTDTVYKIGFGAMSWRPIQWLTWINKDTLLFTQSSNPHYGLIVAINVDKQEYQYYGMASDEYQCVSSTPTP